MSEHILAMPTNTPAQRRAKLLAIIQSGALPPNVARDMLVMIESQPLLFFHPIDNWHWHRAAARVLAWSGHPLRWSWRKLTWEPS